MLKHSLEREKLYKEIETNNDTDGRLEAARKALEIQTAQIIGKIDRELLARSASGDLKKGPTIEVFALNSMSTSLFRELAATNREAAEQCIGSVGLLQNERESFLKMAE